MLFLCYVNNDLTMPCVSFFCALACCLNLYAHNTEDYYKNLKVNASEYIVVRYNISGGRVEDSSVLHSHFHENFKLPRVVP